MTRLYGTLDGDASKKQATRRAHHTITSHTCGWDSGVQVHGYVDSVRNVDVFEIYTTGGSNNEALKKQIAVIVDGVVHLTLPQGRLRGAS